MEHDEKPVTAPGSFLVSIRGFDTEEHGRELPISFSAKSGS
jgi:hypothetical protein